jgi:hypothetical protein
VKTLNTRFAGKVVLVRPFTRLWTYPLLSTSFRTGSRPLFLGHVIREGHVIEATYVWAVES